MGIAILVHQTQDLIACFGGGQNQGNLDAPAGSQGEAPAQAEDRVQNKPLAVAQFLQGAHRTGERSSPANEPAPVGLEAQGFIHGFTGGLFKRKAVRDIDGRFAIIARTAVGQERLLSGQRLGLDEQLVERRMLTIRIVRRQGEFNVTRQVEPAAAGGPIDQRQPPNLNIIFRRDDDLGFALNVVINAAEHGAVQREVGAVSLQFFRRLADSCCTTAGWHRHRECNRRFPMHPVCDPISSV